MYTLGLVMLTCLMPCAGMGIGLVFLRKGRKTETKKPAPEAVPGETLTSIGRLAVAAGAGAAVVTAAVLLLTLHLERPWRVGAAAGVVTVQYAVTMAVVFLAARMLRRK